VLNLGKHHLSFLVAITQRCCSLLRAMIVPCDGVIASVLSENG
jgi:hypothetical protein